MRFHQGVTFLDMQEIVALAVASEEMGYHGMFISDHLFNPKEMRSRYIYSRSEDGSTFWDADTAWPDSMCLISGLATVTTSMLFTTGVYVAPMRDLVTVAKSVGTAAVLSNNRVRLGVGVGWCEEEYEATGQDFHTRGARLNEMIPALRALWDDGWVEYHGEHYDIPPCKLLPAPTSPVPIYGGGESVPALRRTAAMCDGWITPGGRSVDEAVEQVATVKYHLREAGRADDPFDIYLAVLAEPDPATYRRFEDMGVTDMLCAPWMAAPVSPDDSPEVRHARRIEACERFAENVIARM